jgi:DNA-binding transcriptional MocR family regulator
MTEHQLATRDQRGLQTLFEEANHAMIQFVSQVWPSSGENACSPRPVQTRLHVVADFEGVDAFRVSREAATRGVEATPLAAYFAGRARAVNGLVLGFGAVRPDAVSRGMERLGAAIAAASRK